MKRAERKEEKGGSCQMEEAGDEEEGTKDSIVLERSNQLTLPLFRCTPISEFKEFQSKGAAILIG